MSAQDESAQKQHVLQRRDVQRPAQADAQHGADQVGEPDGDQLVLEQAQGPLQAALVGSRREVRQAQGQHLHRVLQPQNHQLHARIFHCLARLLPQI